MDNIFGFGNKVIENLKTKKLSPSFVAPTDFDAPVDVVSETNRFGISFDNYSKDTAHQIDTYRSMAGNSDVVSAIDEITNAAVVNDPDTKPVEIVLGKVDGLSDTIEKKIKDEFHRVLELLDFNNNSDDIFRQWFIDGRLFYHIIVPSKNTKTGIEELRLIDPRKIKKVREIMKEQGPHGVSVVKGIKEYYVYEDDDLHQAQSAIKLDTSAIVNVTSGLKSLNGKDIVSYLHPAIKPFNQLVALEDSLVIYRIARAPERRVFYVDTGNLPATRADQYMRKMIASHKNKTVYDTVTGKVKDNSHVLSMLEDLWIPRREGSNATTVETLPSGQGLGEMDDVLYFMKKLYKALRIPSSRLDDQSALTMGAASEITRDELKFSSFIEKLRKKFSKLFREILMKQLLIKRIITQEDWDKFNQHIQFKFNTDSQFAEMKETEILGRRVDLLSSIDQFVGKYVSIDYVRKHVLNQTEDEYKEEDKLMASEKKAGLYKQEDF